MQELLIEFTILVSMSVLIGLGSSMVGVSGGAFRTPLLILVIGLSTQFSTAISLFSVLFLAVPSSIEYSRSDKKPIMFKLGLVIAALAVPGLFIGVLLKSFIVDDYLLRIIFGVSLFPVALLMLLSRRKQNETDAQCSIENYDIRKKSKGRLVIAGFGSFLAGLSGALLGLGGGLVIVPTMCSVLEIPMLAAAATSVFAMIFISIAGTIMNIAMIPQMGSPPLFLFYALAIGMGKILGGKLGADFACKVDGVLLKRLFGAILVFPLIHLMNLGQMWLDPLGTNMLISTLGDVILWIAILAPFIIGWRYWSRNTQQIQHSIEITESKGS
jgi:uncharacterized membrane protein YfcA